MRDLSALGLADKNCTAKWTTMTLTGAELGGRVVVALVQQNTPGTLTDHLEPILIP